MVLAVSMFMRYLFAKQTNSRGDWTRLCCSWREGSKYIAISMRHCRECIRPRSSVDKGKACRVEKWKAKMYYNDTNIISPMQAFVGGVGIGGVGHDQQMHERLLGWNIPAEYSDLVHPFWRGFLAPPKYWHICLALIYFMMMCLSLVGNGCVVWIFTSAKSLRTPSNMFVVNLALFDLLMMTEMPLLIINSFLERPIGWQLGCDIYAALGSVSGIGSAINNAAIAYDRYKTISSPIDGRLNSKQAAVIIALTWFWSMPFTILPMARIWGRYVPEGFLTTCSFDYLTDDSDTKVFVACIFAWAYCIPMALIIICYSQLIGSVRKHEKMLQEQAKKMNVKSLQSNQDKERSVEMKIAKVAFTIFFLYVCSWTPYAIVAMTAAFGNRNALTPFSTMIPAVFAKIVSCIDPWVYAVNHPRYRLELQERCKWMGIHEPIPAPDTVSAVTEKVNAEEA